MASAGAFVTDGVSESGHLMDRGQLIRESLDWLDRYLGPVGAR
jgi:hypothetical protein